MDTISAFLMGQANRGKKLMVFDWEKAARLIIEKNAVNASAGLSGDWAYTGGEILSNGKIVPRENTYTYLVSTWATPEIEIDGETISCFKMQDETDWDEDTYWPEIAVKIISEGQAND